jgi:hypothetical protein
MGTPKLIDENSNCTDIQLLALDGILEIFGLGYRDLAADALGIKKYLVPDKYTLTHKQALTIIHHGDDLFRR